MGYKVSAQCPCCKKTASRDLNKIEELFGFRTVQDERLIPQSYCRECRSKRCSPGNKKCSGSAEDFVNS
jgi:hypothetical protein